MGEAFPGQPFAGPVSARQAVKIMTGAPMPAGADAVLPAELAELAGARLRAQGEVSPGKHVGSLGEDVAAGATVLAGGRVLRPQDLGVLSSIGVDAVECVSRARVNIVVTGNELLPSGTPPRAFQITDANGPMLSALVQRDGGAIVRREIVSDDRDAIRAALLDAADVVLVSGGSSVGQEDHVPMILAEHGELAIHGIAMRPSSPTGMGRLGDRLVFLLPGNPVSCLCAYDFFAGRAIRALGGRPRDWPYRRVAGKLAQNQFGDRPARLCAGHGPRGRGRAAGDRRRVDSFVDHAGRWFSVDPGRPGRLSGRRRGGSVFVRLRSREARQHQMVSQEQFLEVVDRDEAERRFRAAIRCEPLGVESVELRQALGRVLADDVVASVDVPSFDRSNLDGFAVRADDTYGAREERPRILKLLTEVVATGSVPQGEVTTGTAVSIATGGMLPRGADAIVPVEHAEVSDGEVSIIKAVTAGFGVTFAGTDIGCGETVLRRGELLTSRETGVLAAIGCTQRARLAAAARGHPLDRRRDHRSRRADAARHGLRLERADSGRRGAGTGRRTACAGHRARRSRPAARGTATTRWRGPTSCCSPAARAKAPAICRIASWPSSMRRASWRTAWRSSRASRFVWPRTTASRW